MWSAGCVAPAGLLEVAGDGVGSVTKDVGRFLSAPTAPAEEAGRPFNGRDVVVLEVDALELSPSAFQRPRGALDDLDCGHRECPRDERARARRGRVPVVIEVVVGAFEDASQVALG